MKPSPKISLINDHEINIKLHPKTSTSNLQSKLRALEAELSLLKSQYPTECNYYIGKQTDYNNMSLRLQELTAIQEEFRKFKHKYNSLLTDIDSAKQLLGELKKQNIILNSEVHNKRRLGDIVEADKRVISQLKAEVEELEDKIGKCEPKVSDLTSKLTEKENKLNKLQVQVEKQQTHALELTTTQTLQEARIAELESQLLTKTTTLTDCQSQISSYQLEVDKLKIDLAELKTQNQALKTRYKEQELTITKLTSSNKSLVSANQNLSHLEVENQQKDSEISSLTKKLVETNREWEEKLKTKDQENKYKHKSHSNSLSTHKLELDIEREKCMQLSRQVRKYQSELQAMELHFSRKLEGLNPVKQQVRVQEKELCHVKSVLKQSQHINSQLQHSIDQLKQKHHDIHTRKRHEEDQLITKLQLMASRLVEAENVNTGLKEHLGMLNSQVKRKFVTNLNLIL